MILVTLGTQDKKFYRLLDYIEEYASNAKEKEKIVVQAGCSSDYQSKYMDIFDLIPFDEFDSMIEACDILITHGGVGSIISGLKRGKKVIACARLKKYGEHTNDHQLQIIDNFVREGYILKLDENDDLKDVFKSLKNFKPKKFESNTENFASLVKKEIDKYF